jgi:putative MATE family efflux protein
MARRDLTTGPIPDHFRALALPTAIGMLFTTLYNVVDVYYAGMLGTEAQAGLAISFTVFFVLFVAIGIGLSSAMGALVGHALGKRSGQESLIAAQGLSFGLGASVCLMAIGWFAAPWLIALVSEPGAYRDAANQYLRVLMLGAPAFVIAHVANGILTAQGDTRSMQYANMAAFFANLLLNPLFIFGWGPLKAIGFDGIALSTVVSQTGVMAYVLWRAIRSDAMGGTRRFAPEAAMMRQIVGQALPSTFSMVVMMMAGFAIQFFLKGFGGEAVAAYGIALRIEQLILLPAFGLTGALLPIAAQNYGAGNFDRVREATMFCFKAGVALMLAGSCILWFAAGPAMATFTNDARVIEIGKSYLHIDGFILPVYVTLFAITSLLQALKKPIYTLWIGIYRQGLGVALFSWLFVHVFELGYLGIWIGIATAVTTGLMLSLALTERLARELIGGLFSRIPAGRVS